MTWSQRYSRSTGRKAEPPQTRCRPIESVGQHIQRIYELCGRNVSETARRLNMHRRHPAAHLAKRAPK